MEQQQPVRRRLIGKQRPRPSEFVLVCQPLAAQRQLVPVTQPLVAEPQPKRKRTQTGTRVQLAGQRISCSESLHGALMARLRQGRGSRSTWTRKQWQLVAQHIPTPVVSKFLGDSSPGATLPSMPHTSSSGRKAGCQQLAHEYLSVFASS